MHSGELQRAAVSTAAERRAMADVIVNAAAFLCQLDASHDVADLDRLRQALGRPEVTVVVAGESGVGKSSVINAILGLRLVPADVLTTTSAPTWIRWAEVPSIEVVTVDSEGTTTRSPLTPRAFEHLVSAPDPPIDSVAVDCFEIGLPHPLLSTGLTLIDTPSISGGLASPTAAAVLGLIAGADAVLFVSECGQELSFTEMEFLQVAEAVNYPTIIVAKTRTDLYPDWDRVVDIDRQHLERHLRPITVFGVSPELSNTARRLEDSEVERESGVPVLERHVTTTLLTQALQQRIAGASVAVQARLREARDGLEDRRLALGDDTQRSHIEDELMRSEQRLRRLETDWGDAFTHALSGFRIEAQRGLDDRLREVGTELLAAIDETDPGSTWPAIETRVHRATNQAIGEYLQTTADQAELVVVRMANFLDVDRSQLDVDVSGFELGGVGIAAELERPEFRATRGRGLDVARSSISTGTMMGGGTIGAFLTSAGASITVGATVITGGVGLVAATATAAVLLQRARSSDIEARRRDAKQSIRSYLSELSRQVSRVVETSHAQALFDMRSGMKKQMELLHKRTILAIEQLRHDHTLSAQDMNAKQRELDTLIEQCSIVLSHARKTDHRLARPDVQIDRTPPGGSQEGRPTITTGSLSA